MSMNRKALVLVAIALTALVGVGVVVADPWQGEPTIVTEETSDLSGGDVSDLVVENGDVTYGEDQTLIWESESTYEGSFDSTVAYTETHLVGADGALTGHNRETGAIDWTIDDQKDYDSVKTDSGKIYAADQDANTITVFDADTRTEELTITASESISHFDVDGDRVGVASRSDNTVALYDANTGENVWSTVADDSVYTVAVGSDHVAAYDFTSDTVIYDRTDGSVVESTNIDGQSDLIIDDGVMIAAKGGTTGTNDLTAYDISTSTTLWIEEYDNRPQIAVDGDRVAIEPDSESSSGSNDLELELREKSTGNLLWEFVDSNQEVAESLAFQDSDLAYSGASGTGQFWDGNTEEGTFTSSSYGITNPESGTVTLADLDDTVATVEWQYNDGAGWQTEASTTTTSNGDVTQTLTTAADEWRVVVGLERDGSAARWDGTIQSHSLEWENDAPVLSDPDPQDSAFVDDRSQVDLSVDVDDNQFDSSQGEEVEVTFYDASDDSVIGSDTVTEPDRASTTWSGVEMGQNSWYAVGEDNAGSTTETSTLTFETPSELEIRDETAPDELVTTESEVEVTFFDDDDVITRTTTDGVVDLEGLPADQAFVVQVEADGYVTRQSIIPSITQQQEVYLLPGDVESVSVRFDVDDSTGSFPPEDTRILIEKPLTRDGETRYKLIAGDDYGAQGFSTVLQIDQRYRAIVENTETGQRQSLGPYVASQSETVTLQVDSIAFDTEVEEIGYRWGADYQNATDSEPRVEFGFEADNEIESLTVTIRERGGDEQILLSESFNNVQQVNEIADLGDIENPDETTYVVEWEATVIDEDGQAFDVSGSEIVGADQLPVDIPGVGDDVLHVVSVLLLFLVGGLFSAANVEIGAVVVSLTAAAFWLIGMLPGVVSGLFIGAALLLSVMWMVRNARGEQ